MAGMALFGFEKSLFALNVLTEINSIVYTFHLLLLSISVCDNNVITRSDWNKGF